MHEDTAYAPATPRTLTLRELADLHDQHAQRYYRRRSGEPTREHLNCRSAIERFVKFAGEACPTSRINKHQLRAWLDQLAAEQLSREYCNACLSRVRRMIRWAVDLDYIDARALIELQAVRPLQAFRSPAKEPPRRQPADLAVAQRVLQILAPHHRDIVQLVMLTGARLSEIIELRSTDVHLDAPGPRLQLEQHKTAHKGRSRVIPLNAAAVAIIERRLKPLCPLDPLFPAPKSRKHEHLSPDSLRAAIKRACARLGSPAFTPHQVRHAVAALVRERAGLDAAAALLGHAQISMTEHYAPLRYEQALRASEVIR